MWTNYVRTYIRRYLHFSNINIPLRSEKEIRQIRIILKLKKKK